MGLGKSKNAQIDIDGLMNDIDTDRQVEEETAATEKWLEELRIAQNNLKEATATLNDAVAALNAAKKNADSIVSSFNKAIVDAQENTKFKVYIGKHSANYRY